jgi:hypothetical protein
MKLTEALEHAHWGIEKLIYEIEHRPTAQTQETTRRRQTEVASYRQAQGLLTELRTLLTFYEDLGEEQSS